MIFIYLLLIINMSNFLGFFYIFEKKCAKNNMITFISIIIYFFPFSLTKKLVEIQNRSHPCGKAEEHLHSATGSRI